MLISIAAMSQNRVIGKDNKLPRHLPSDLKRFKQLTKNKTIIIWRKTYESIGKLLPYRHHIILSTTLTEQEVVATVWSSCKIIHNLEDIKILIAQNPEKEMYCVWWGQLYRELLPLTDKIELTLVDTDIDWDILFPEFEQEFQEKNRSEIIQENSLNYRFLSFVRKSWTLISH